MFFVSDLGWARDQGVGGIPKCEVFQSVTQSVWLRLALHNRCDLHPSYFYNLGTDDDAQHITNGISILYGAC